MLYLYIVGVQAERPTERGVAQLMYSNSIIILHNYASTKSATQFTFHDNDHKKMDQRGISVIYWQTDALR